MTTICKSQHDIEHFDRWAASYDRSRIQRYIGLIHDEMLRMPWISGITPENILDVGCGTGRLLKKAADCWPQARLTGIDPADGMIAAARRALPEASFHVAGAESIPLPDGSVDLVLTAISFHHWADQSQGLREIHRVLRSGGHLCLADIALPGWLASVLHSKARSAKELGQLVSRAMFEPAGQRTLLARVISIIDASKRPSSGPVPG